MRPARAHTHDIYKAFPHTSVEPATAQIPRRGRIENARSSPFQKIAVGEPTATIAE